MKKKIKKYKWGRIALLVFTPILIFVLYFLFREIKAGLIKYKEFGVYIPKKYEIHGIDVSHYQQIINWKAVKNMEVEGVKINFAYVKATQGARTIDLQYFQNKLRIKRAGITFGAYHFFVATKDPEVQANLFCNLVSLEKGDLPPVLDIEKEYGVSHEKIRSGLKTWLRLVENKYGVKPIIYTNSKFYEQILQGYFDKYPLWVAHYDRLTEPELDNDWIIWQLSEDAHVNGIEGNADFNVFKGSKEDFEKLKIN